MDDNYFEVEESMPLLPTEQQADDTSLIDLPLEGSQPPSPRKRLAQIGLVVVTLVVVAVLLRGVSPASRPTSGGSSATPQPTVPPTTLLITSNINFGVVSINGKRQQGSLPMFFGARSATYSITITAAPFRPESCTIYFTGQEPQTSDQNCIIGSGNFSSITANGVTAVPDYALEIDFTANDLPLDQQNQISTLLAQSITTQQSIAVPTGSYVATSFDAANNTVTSQRATTTLQATASLAASANFEAQYAFDCTGLICRTGIDITQYIALSGNVWMIGIPVALRWQFMNAAGRKVGDVSFPTTDLLPTLLTYSPSAGWSISDQTYTNPFNNPNALGYLDCNTGMLVLEQHLQTTGAGISTSTTTSQGISGCKITLMPTSNASQGAFIWRFGVLLAVDKAAHQVLPDLPMAPQAEIDAVQG